MPEVPLTKVCTKCGIEKPLEEFSPSKSGTRFGRSAVCKTCKNKDQNQRRANNPDFIEKHNKSRRDKLLLETPDQRQERLAKDRAYRSQTKEERNASNRLRYANDPELREKMILSTRAYYADHREEQVAKATLRKNRLISTDLQYKIKSHLRSRLGSALKKEKKVGSFVRDLGCTIPELKAHLESKFQIGMTWENWGRGKGNWNIDHIIPLSAFTLTDRQHFLLACNYLNLQPLWFEENMIKGHKYEGAF